MNAGSTNVPVNTRIRVTRIADADADERSLVGVTGRITHPFQGYLTGTGRRAVAGVWLDDEFHKKHGSIANLLEGDGFELVEDE